MKYIFILFLFSALFSQNIRGHEHPDGFLNKRERPNILREKIENMMIWRLTEHLELKPEQADKFFPKLRDHRNSIEEIKTKEREIEEKISIGLEKSTTFSMSEITKTIEVYFSLQKSRIELEEKFTLSMEGLLSPNQIAVLGLFKHRMMKDMKDEYKKHRGGKKRRGRKK